MEQPIEKQFQNLSLSSEPTEEEHEFQNIRISFSSRFSNRLDEVVAAIVRNAKGMQLMVWGPYMLPTRVVTEYDDEINPFSERMRDSELQYHGRVVDVLGSSELVEQMISSVSASNVNIEVTVVDLGNQMH